MWWWRRSRDEDGIDGAMRKMVLGICFAFSVGGWAMVDRFDSVFSRMKCL